MPTVVIGDFKQEELPDSEMMDLVKSIVEMGHKIIVRYNFTTDKRLLRGEYKIEWFYIYYQFDDESSYHWQEISLPTDGNGISYSICMAYLYGLYNGLRNEF